MGQCSNMVDGMMASGLAESDLHEQKPSSRLRKCETRRACTIAPLVRAKSKQHPMLDAEGRQ